MWKTQKTYLFTVEVLFKMKESIIMLLCFRVINMIKKLSVLFLLAVTACQLTSIKSVPPAETKRVSQEKDERGLTTIEEEEEIINLFRQQKKIPIPQK